MKSFRFLLFVSVILLAHRVAAAQSLSTPAEVGTFAAALESCTAATARTRHLLMPTFVVEHTVDGQKGGTCAYRQTMPGNMMMTCGLSETGRVELATEIRKLAEGGPVTGGTTMAAPAWFKECEILMPNGNRVPAAPAR